MTDAWETLIGTRPRAQATPKAQPEHQMQRPADGGRNATPIKALPREVLRTQSHAEIRAACELCAWHNPKAMTNHRKGI